jgi:hypothetical protein
MIVAAFSAVLSGCKSDSPLAPLQRAARIEAASAVNFEAVVGTTAASAPTVRVTDRDGHPIGDVPVAFLVTAGSGSVNPSIASTDADGRATTVWQLGTTTGTATLTARVGVFAPIVFTAKVLAGPPTLLEKSGGDNQLVLAGTAANPLSARVLDSFHNPVAGISVSFSVVSGGGTVSPANVVTDSMGSVSANWTLGAAEGVQTARAQAAGMSVVFSADAFSCTAAPCSALGELIVVRTADGQIYRLNVNGSGLTRLTSEGNNISPVWSPDGNRIAFIRVLSQSSGGTSDVFLMNADGSNVTRRTTGGQYYSVTWSPDGSKLAVDGPSGGDSLNISTMSVDAGGPGPTILKTNAASPSWSPDGTRVAYARGTGYYEPSQIYLMNADGSNAHRATPDSAGWNWGPAWSPDGKKISFTRCTLSCGVYTMDLTSSAVTLVSPAGSSQDATWSPDGRWIAVTIYGTNAPSVYYIPAEGGTPQMILGNALHPSWRPGVH